MGATEADEIRYVYNPHHDFGKDHNPYNMDQNFKELGRRQQHASTFLDDLTARVWSRGPTDCYICGGDESFGEFTPHTTMRQVASAFMKIRFHESCAIQHGILVPEGPKAQAGGRYPVIDYGAGQQDPGQQRFTIMVSGTIPELLAAHRAIKNQPDAQPSDLNLVVGDENPIFGCSGDGERILRFIVDHMPDDMKAKGVRAWRQLGPVERDWVLQQAAGKIDWAMDNGIAFFEHGDPDYNPLDDVPEGLFPS